MLPKLPSRSNAEHVRRILAPAQPRLAATAARPGALHVRNAIAAVQRKAPPQPPHLRQSAPHLQAAQAKLAALHVVQRAAEKKAETAPQKAPEKAAQKILDLRPKRFGDTRPMSNYEASIRSITNAAAYGVDKAPIVYVTSGWHAQNEGTPIERWHFDISLDGSTQLHVYWDAKAQTATIESL